MCFFWQKETMSWILLGKITKPVGLSGQVKVFSYTDDLDIFLAASKLRLSKKELEEAEEIEGQDIVIEEIEPRDRLVIIKFQGSDDRDDAEAMRGRFLYVNTDQLEDLPEGSFYVYEIRGFEVVSQEGRPLGSLKDVNMQAGQPLYVVEGLSGKLSYIPGVPAFIKSIDAEKRKIVINLIEGLVDED